jgi:hypothetical protein
MRGLSPVLVTSPTVRSGTTLLQRLLCSSPGALIYGEEIGKDLDLQLQIFSSRKLVYAHSRQRFAAGLEQVLAGDTGDWILDLMPGIDGYLDALHRGAFAGLDHCRQQAEAAGRTVWGFKYPGWPPHLTRQLFDHLPGTRVVFMVRDLADTARSAKAWGGLAGEHDLQALCGQWLQGVQFMQQWQRDHAVLMLSFEDLVAEPAAVLAQLQDFLGVSGMDPRVLERRINNLTQGLDTRHGHNGYIAPAPLTAPELALVQAATAAAQLHKMAAAPGS